MAVTGSVTATGGGASGATAGWTMAPCCAVRVAQAANVPKMLRLINQYWSRFMSLIFLEALAALVLLLLIVWWTMFSGRKKGELPDRSASEPVDPPSTDPH